MADPLQEQEMEIEALKAILMDEFEEIHPSESGLNTSNRCFQIRLSPQDDETDESSTSPVQLALIFSHTEKYPDEIPLLYLKSIRGIPASDLNVLKEKLEQEASENLGMAMIYTLVTSAKDWLSERFAQDNGYDNNEEGTADKDEILVPHGEPVTVETFLAWRERFEAELALERANIPYQRNRAGHFLMGGSISSWMLTILPLLGCCQNQPLQHPKRRNSLAGSGFKAEELLLGVQHQSLMDSTMKMKTSMSMMMILKLMRRTCWSTIYRRN